MTGGSQEPEPRVAGFRLFSAARVHETQTILHAETEQNQRTSGVANAKIASSRSSENCATLVAGQESKLVEFGRHRGQEDESHEDGEEAEEEDGELLSEALLAVASAEEYAARIIKIQQACLTPLKEDLADWLNKIMNVSTITTDNFMEKLDNGVIICHLAKIISRWCQQQHQQQHVNLNTNLPQQQNMHNRANSQAKLDLLATSSIKTPNSSYLSQTYNPQLSTSTLDVHLQTSNIDVETNDPSCLHSNKITASLIATNFKTPQTARPSTLANGSGASRTSSCSTNCLTTSATSSINGVSSLSKQFFSNLSRMDQTKIWDDAKCRTFYARDNVCNFIKWSKEFGVNQSVLFESDDLVLHANPRQVVLCLLDVARIACVKYGFTEAPGLVRFEQEIDRELAAEKAALGRCAPSFSENLYGFSEDGHGFTQTDEVTVNRTHPSLTSRAREYPVTDSTDELILRYCRHKEEEAARKKAAEIEAIALKAAEAVQRVKTPPDEPRRDEVENDPCTIQSDILERPDSNQTILYETDSLINVDEKESDDLVIKSQHGESLTPKTSTNYDSRVDSLDSGEGRTESASTSHSRTPVNTPRRLGPSAIPLPIKRSNSSSSLVSNQTSSLETSELSSSRSSLLSGQENSANKRHIASDLDGKVMRIAKSYYGKGAVKGVTRLSEGKYKIADRIVFVRLLKGHRVMVRIGGGWDTLENFLFRHKSDPSQVIDVDNLLPIETKITLEKNSHLTPASGNKLSKLPYYRRSSSASSTNLSISNLSISNNSPISMNTLSANSASTPSHTDSETSHHQPIIKQVPYLLIHRGQNSKPLAQSAFFDRDNTPHTNLYSKGPLNQPAKSFRNPTKYNNRPLGSSRTPTASATNLYPATLTTRIAATNIKMMEPSKVGSTNNLHNGGNSRQEASRKLGRSNESLQAFYNRSAQLRLQQNGFSHGKNASTKKKLETNRKSVNSSSRGSASVKS